MKRFPSTISVDLGLTTIPDNKSVDELCHQYLCTSIRGRAMQSARLFSERLHRQQEPRPWTRLTMSSSADFMNSTESAGDRAIQANRPPRVPSRSTRARRRSVDRPDDGIRIHGARLYIPRRHPAPNPMLLESLDNGVGDRRIRRCVADKYVTA